MDDELLSWQSLATLQGAAAAVLAVTNVLGMVVGAAFDSIRKWLALVLSLAAGLIGLTAAENVGYEQIIVAILNGFMIAAAVLGVNEAGASITGAADVNSAQTSSRFFRAWI